MNQHYNIDPNSDEAQALQLLAMSIKPTKVERIGNSIKWTFGTTFTESRDEELNAEMIVVQEDDMVAMLPSAVPWTDYERATPLQDVERIFGNIFQRDDYIEPEESTDE